MDTDDDRRVDLDEFKAWCAKMDLGMSDEECVAEFDKIDQNDGNLALFDEVCAWYAAKKHPNDSDAASWDLVEEQ